MKTGPFSVGRLALLGRPIIATNVLGLWEAVIALSLIQGTQLKFSNNVNIKNVGRHYAKPRQLGFYLFLLVAGV